VGPHVTLNAWNVMHQGGYRTYLTGSRRERDQALRIVAAMERAARVDCRIRVVDRATFARISGHRR